MKRKQHCDSLEFFSNTEDFEKNMHLAKQILEQYGALLESNHPYAYAMQYRNAFEKVESWLYAHGYEGELMTSGYHEGVAVYGLYDSEKISYEEMQMLLKKEAFFQNREF